MQYSLGSNMIATVSREASKQNASASPNMGFAVHFARTNASYFAKHDTVMHNCSMSKVENYSVNKSSFLSVDYP